ISRRPPTSTLFAYTTLFRSEGVAIVHGHSSHHVKASEIFKSRLILYGCGDFLTDYEGISGYESFRSDLALMYLVDVDSENGQLRSEEHTSELQSRGHLVCRL